MIMARTYGALSDAEVAWVRNQMSKGAKAAKAGAALGGVGKLASKGAAKLGGVAKAGAALGGTAKLASKGAAKLGSAAKTAARGIKNVASKASKSIYPSMPGAAVAAGKAAARGASKIASKIRK